MGSSQSTEYHAKKAELKHDMVSKRYGLWDSRT